ncbi:MULTISPECIES: bifunctional chorismate mutase/prephenate dehydrogenase [Pasteurellaceae]|uniref:T-protein n=1 Tax=Pasteurella atlantica TaxID=2827233 RepID=A0AAW8CNZ1_9PAST|nr:bifunctional chorismate mutase/prephenate dehydrogenase [Pasteurella atlantica]MBR0573769.1 bifunctional chorismate mutase/prephenate dehydrogenase [Pasteurella atlantica]MDP8039705.1 bifunctional chorismate mutase/prephenate dehydrogenase [Pasteurella atlantica]MDP8041890.1 bifunctional chorismate mutase/prephenate dehydrogenase [Pasteurella atlantica]MDP8044085.1 bifunctional chorismate mutase/prephenate dehydrogenase [Pasteurella atlantica]MDP8046063.1 bifunctional chorismate mutase/prep
MNPLDPIRNKIDDIDQQLVELFSQRLKLVEDVGKIKSEYGLPVYDPEREDQMILARRTEAEKQGVPATLIEDVLRRLMRESYANEHHHGFKTVNPNIKKIVIVGGKGKLGGLFARYFDYSGYKVEILDKEDWHNATIILANADVVIVSVPIAHTLNVIEALQPYLTSNMILADLTSVKAKPVEKMLEIHNGAVVGLHPMFGSDITSFAKQVIACCDGRLSESYQWLLEQIQIWGAKIEFIDAKDHDHTMTYIQALRHFSTFVAGFHLSQQPIKLSQLLALSSPIYRLELAMIGRLFAQDAELYADIIADKPENLIVIKSLEESFQQCFAYFETQDKQGFVDAFEKVHQWFGDYSDQFLKESSALLQQANDYRK